MAVESRREAQPLPGGIPMKVACVLTCGALTTYNGNRIANGAIKLAHYLSGENKLVANLDRNDFILFGFFLR